MLSDNATEREEPGTDQAPSARRLETRTRLLDGATLVFAEEGLRGASVESICQRAGFSRGAFYSNFSSKEELFIALLDREYLHRASWVRERVDEVTRLVSEQGACVTPEDAARYVAEFFAPTGTEATWFALESEFTLLAMRDPEDGPGFSDFIVRFRIELAELVEQIIHAAGRRFRIPAERAMPVLAGIYDRAFKVTALAGASAPEGFDELGERIAEVLFALTEEA